jgi:hypothetical protein
MTAICPSCLSKMPAERKAAGYRLCIPCSPQFALKGANVYGHKTAGAVEIMHPATYAVYRKVTTRKAKGTHGPSFQRGTTAVYR